MIIPVFSVIATVSDTHAPIFNLRQVEPTLWVKLPCELIHLQVCDVVSESGNTVSWTRDGSQSWMYVETSGLNLSIGYHVYQINMKDPVTDWRTSIYFAYIIQTDTPDKPYYYMGEYREEA